jgi:hypothetical protein
MPSCVAPVAVCVMRGLGVWDVERHVWVSDALTYLSPVAGQHLNLLCRSAQDRHQCAVSDQDDAFVHLPRFPADQIMSEVTAASCRRLRVASAWQ